MSYKKIITDSQQGSQRRVSEIWKETQQIEKLTEEYFKNFINNDDGSFIIRFAPPRKHPEWDVKVFFQRDLVETYIELKGEFEAQDYGSCFVEYLEGGKPSGLALTKSDYYYFLTGSEGKPTDAYLVPTWKVKEIGRNTPKNLHKSGGINGSATGFLLKLHLIDDFKVSSFGTNYCIY